MYCCLDKETAERHLAWTTSDDTKKMTHDKICKTTDKTVKDEKNPECSYNGKPILICKGNKQQPFEVVEILKEHSPSYPILTKTKK